MSTMKGDLYSNLLGELELFSHIESRLKHYEFSDGVAYWWYNADAKILRPSKSEFVPQDFLGNSNWILVARTIDGMPVIDQNVIERYVHGSDA